MSVILLLSGKFLKFHQKSVAYSQLLSETLLSPPPPLKLNPNEPNLEHMLLGGIGCTEVLFFLPRLKGGKVSHLSETHLNVNFRRVACP